MTLVKKQGRAQVGPMGEVNILEFAKRLSREELDKRIEQHGPWMTFDIISGPSSKDFAQNYFSLSNKTLPKPYFKARMVLNFIDKRNSDKAYFFPGEFKFEFHSFFSATSEVETGFKLWVKVFYKVSLGSDFKEFKFPGQNDYEKQVKIFGSYHLYEKKGVCGVEF